jgi:hypothetical protein
MRQVDLRKERSMIRCDANARSIKDARRSDLRRLCCQHAVQRQNGARDWESRLCRSTEFSAKQARRQGQPAPWAPLVQITYQHCRAGLHAEHMLTDRAQLGPSQTLPQGKVSTDQTKALIALRKVSDDSTTMTPPRRSRRCIALSA